MSVLVILEVKAKPNSREALTDYFRKNLPDTREYDGCQNITTHLSDDGVSVVLVEHWDSKEHYDKYLAWRTERGDVAALEKLFEDPKFRFFNFWGA